MNENDDRTIVAGLWMEKAEKNLLAAQSALTHDHAENAANRLYYTALYAVSAVLAARGQTYGKHSAVRAALHRDLIHTGLVTKELGILYAQLFTDRHEADYTVGNDLNTKYLKRQAVKVADLLAQLQELLDEI